MKQGTSQEMSNRDQADFWNTEAGPNWVAHQAALDAAFAPVLDLVLAEAAPEPGQSVLDIGCGTGASVLGFARAVGPNGRVLGVDISATLLALARDRLEGIVQAQVVEADAARDPLHGPHDLAVSRFGVMFFDDPAAAFAHIAAALRPGARLVMSAWGPAPQNPWFMEPAAVARARLGPPPRVDRTLPGPFAWEEAARVTDQLMRAGLSDVQVSAREVHLTPADGLRGAARLSTHIGPAQSVLRHFNGTEADRAAIEDGIAAAFASYDSAEGLRIPALINLVTARVPA